MLVVADSSPLIALLNIDEIRTLPALFGEVIVPPDVVAELRKNTRPEMVRSFVHNPPAWFVERSPRTVEVILELHAGELAAISLARELNADLLLIDEAEGRRAAAARRIPVTGTVGILELAADLQWLDLGTAFQRLKGTDFWISHRLLDERLRLYHRRSSNQ
jgi:predicted nucleic acid-binding protein